VLPGQRVRAGQGVVDQVVDRPAGRGRGEDAGLDAGQFEQVADHAAEPFDLGADAGLMDARVVGHAVLQRLRHRLQADERGAQVVGDPRGRFAQRLLQIPLPLPGGGEPGAGGGQLAAEFGQFGGGCGGGRGEAAVLGEGAAVLGEGAAVLGRGPAAPHHRAPREERHGERDDRRHGAHHRDDPQVVVGQQHRPGHQRRPGEHRGQ
jgi:hypothetical protein